MGYVDVVIGGVEMWVGVVFCYVVYIVVLCGYGEDIGGFGLGV